MKMQVAVMAAVLALAGCSKPMDVIIPSDVAQWDKELAPAIKKLTPEEQSLLQGYLMRNKLLAALDKDSQGIPIGTTVGDALVAQRKWAAEAEVYAAAQRAKKVEAQALKERLLEEEKAKRAELDKAVTVTLISKQEVPADASARRYRAQQGFSVGIKNLTDKRMAGVAGKLEFVDVFGKVVGAMSFGSTDSIGAGGAVVWRGERDYNQFIAEHRAVWDLQEGKYTTRFVPETIVFEDGSKLSSKK